MALRGERTPPGTAQAEWILRPANSSMICWPNWRRRMPARASSGSAAIRPNTLRLAGSLSQPSRKSGLLRWKNERAWLWQIWAKLSSRRSWRAAGGGCTPSSLSPVLAAASRGLTGQMPQMRAVMPAISVKGRPSQKVSKPRYSTTWKRAAAISPASSRCRVILAWPSMRVTGSIVIVRGVESGFMAIGLR